MTSLRFLSVSLVRDEVDPHTRRRVPVDPPRVELALATERGTVRRVPLDQAQLANLLAAAAEANRVMLQG